MNGDREKNIFNDGDVIESDEGLLFNPYNEVNIDIEKKDILSILTKFGLPPIIHNIKLYQRAFIHKSYTKRPALENELENITIAERPGNCMRLRTKSNERLEFIGDGVLECITKYYLYRRFPKADEGFMTEKKIALVKNEHIGKLAYDMGLNKWYVISRNAEEKKIRTNLKKLGCLFEAFLGALFLDFNKIKVNDEENWFKNIFKTGPGLQMAQLFVENIFESLVDWNKLITTNDNYKNILQVKIQKEFKVTPLYLQISHDPDDGYEMGVYLSINVEIQNNCIENAKSFEYYGSIENIHKYIENDMAVFIFLGKGSHKIKKKAEQIACKEGINIFK